MVAESFLQNGFEGTLNSKKNVLSVWKDHLSICATFWVTKLKPFCGKVRQSVQNYLNQNLVLRSFQDNGFEATLSLETKVVSIWKSVFMFFANLWVTKLKPFFRKVRQSVQNYWNQNLVIESFFKNRSGGTLSSKMNLLHAWKAHFSVFCKFLSGKVETIFWESQAKRLKLFKSTFGQGKPLRKMFWRYFELKNECFNRFKNAFFSFLQVFEWRNWNHFLGKWGKAFKTH